MTSLESWKSAKRPNYTTNVDLRYPYSELPYIPQYKLIKIPSIGLIEHVDYWGEGRITIKEGSSGFPACYNVNRQYQQVSNGLDTGHKIPNRIPVRDENYCDTRAYIKDDSVKLVTLMGSPINPSSAKDITRMLNKRVGMIIVYSKVLEDPHVKILISELKNKLIFHCPGYELSDYLKEPTLFPSSLAFLNEEMIKEHLFKFVSTGDYDKAVTLSKSLKRDNAEFVINEVINRLLRARQSNVFGFANKLWNGGEKRLVETHFPEPIILVTKQQKIKIISKYWNQALILNAQMDSINDRSTWGDSKDQSSYRVSWKLIPIWQNNNLLFKIMNVEHSMYLKLNVNTDEYGYGDRSVWGSNDSSEQRHLWKLIPVSENEELLFLVENHEYGQGIKLDSNVDDYGYGDRQAWGHHGNVEDSPNYYGFLIKSWE